MAVLESSRASPTSGGVNRSLEPRETLGRFLRRFYLVTKGTLLHPTTDTYIDELPDGRMVAREVKPGAD